MAQEVKRFYSKNLITRLRVQVPIKPFFFAFAKIQDSFVIYIFAENACFDVLCTCKRLHSVQWRSLYGDTETMQELLLKTCTSSARSKIKVWNETVTESCMGLGCSTHWR